MDHESVSWPTLVDAAADLLRLEPPRRCAYGRLATLHLVAAIWGEIALLRAAQRFVERHHVTLAELLDFAPAEEGEAVWFGRFLAQLAQDGALLPLPALLFRPAAPGLAL